MIRKNARKGLFYPVVGALGTALIVVVLTLPTALFLPPDRTDSPPLSTATDSLSTEEAVFCLNPTVYEYRNYSTATLVVKDEVLSAISNYSTNSPAGGKYDLACQVQHFGVYMQFVNNTSKAPIGSELVDLFGNNSNLFLYYHPFSGMQYSSEIELRVNSSSSGRSVFTCNSLGSCQTRTTGGGGGGCTPAPSGTWSTGSFGWAICFNECATQQIIGILVGGGGVAAGILAALAYFLPASIPAIPIGMAAAALVAAAGAYITFLDALGNFGGIYEAGFMYTQCAFLWWWCTTIYVVGFQGPNPVPSGF